MFESDGAGFASRTQAEDAGLTNMRDRLGAVGGTLGVESCEGRGTRIIGMVPLANGLGEGGEQNAPLGRAVIGGLLFATVATLFFVPVVFSIFHGRRLKRASSAQERTS